MTTDSNIFTVFVVLKYQIREKNRYTEIEGGFWSHTVVIV